MPVPPFAKTYEVKVHKICDMVLYFNLNYPYSYSYFCMHVKILMEASDLPSSDSRVGTVRIGKRKLYVNYLRNSRSRKLVRFSSDSSSEDDGPVTSTQHCQQGHYPTILVVKKVCRNQYPEVASNSRVLDKIE